jgi:predicted nucleotidyltransferase
MKFFPDINVFENTQLSQTPKITDQTQFLTESVEKDLNISQNILNSFNIQTKLNPEIWQDDKLNKEVRKNLLKIAIDLVEELKQPEIKIKDVLFVGSLANYNWSKYSDVDLHILIDFSKFKEDEEFIKKFFDAQKDLYNQKHDIKIFDFPVEIYFQDVEEKLEASAVYSVKSDKWLEKPEKEKQKLDIPSIKKKAKRIIDQIKDIKKEFDSKNWEQVVKKADNLKNSIKTKRKSGLENGGEYSTENIVYKILRRTDAIEMINTLKTNAYDNIVTVPEDLNEADKYIPYDERPEMRAAAKAGVSNKDVISDEKLYNVMNECSMAKRAVLAYKEAFQKNESSFVANYMGQKMVGRIPDGFRANPDNLHYFDVPEMGDGGFQFKLYRNGNIVGTHVKARGNMDVNPNMHGATDPGYDKNYEDRIKYFTVKAGFQGKYRDAMVYSVFDSPAIDGSIKVRVINYPEIIDFLTKDKGHMQYTADEKGNELSNQMDFKKKIEKIRKDAEQVIGRPISSNTKWIAYKTDLEKRFDTPEKQAQADVNQEVKNFVQQFKDNTSQPVGKAQVSLGSDENSDWDKEQAAKQARLQAFKDRKAGKK